MDYSDQLEILTNDIIQAHHEFNLLNGLFAESDERLELLNLTANNFFYDLRRILTERCILNIAKLTDSYVQGSNTNLSLFILKEIGKAHSWEYYDKIESSLDELKTLVKKIRDHRRKYVAHRDEPIALDRSNLDKITYGDLKVAFEKIGEIMNIYYLNEENSQWEWNPIVPGDVDSLVAYLRYGAIFEQILKQDRELRDKLIEYDQKLYKNT